MYSTASRRFRRRYYHSAIQLWHDLRQLAALRATAGAGEPGAARAADAGSHVGQPVPLLRGVPCARRWAEAAGAPDRNTYAQLVVRYGSDLAAGIELMLHAIQIGNLLGNTGDYLLFQVSGGRLGQHEEHG